MPSFEPPIEQLGEVFRYLRKKGFSPVSIKAGTRIFEGILRCHNQSLKVRLTIYDWNFLDYPAIEVIETPDGFPSLAPHIDSKGWLCYFRQGSVILDRYDPAESIAQCLDQAELVLTNIIFNPEYRRNDIQNEFNITWLGSQSIKIWPVLIGQISKNAISSNYYLIQSEHNSYALISSSEEEVQGLSKALRGTECSQTTCPCWLFETQTMPYVPESMPANVKDLFGWLKAWDKALYSRVQKVLETQKEYLNYKFATFAIKSPIGWLGFGFEIDNIHRLGYANKPNRYKQYLHGHGESIGILRLMIDECSPEFVHSRNLTFQDLKGKKIAVIGCGAIGSQVIPGLVRLGAGSGSGVIEIIDNGYIEAENLGRHYLGFPALFQPKVNALADELKRQFPIVNIIPKFETIRSFKGLASFDLIIDATGEEAVSEMLNGYRIQVEKDVPILHIRVRGNGESVQTFWAQGKRYGCFRCLLNPSGKEYRQEKYKLLKNDPVFKQVGCSAFTPYAINAPISAAALALEVVVDWLKIKDPSPRFRTRSCSSANVYEVKDQNVKRQPGCPACDS